MFHHASKDMWFPQLVFIMKNTRAACSSAIFLKNRDSAEIAAEVGVSKSVITNYKDGTDVGKKTEKKILKAYGLKKSEIKEGKLNSVGDDISYLFSLQSFQKLVTVLLNIKDEPIQYRSDGRQDQLSKLIKEVVADIKGVDVLDDFHRDRPRQERSSGSNKRWEYNSGKF